MAAPIQMVHSTTIRLQHASAVADTRSRAAQTPLPQILRLVRTSKVGSAAMISSVALTKRRSTGTRLRQCPHPLVCGQSRAVLTQLP
eukprot:1251394-Prymnesium_polylepis.1